MNRVATERDLDPIAATLALAFEQDPVWGMVFAEVEDRRRRLEGLAAVFEGFAAAALPHGWVRVSGAVQAAAIWIPPGQPELGPGDEARLFEAVERIVGPEGRARLGELTAGFDRHHPSGPPHYYLSMLGTNPEQAGRGIGIALVESCLTEIDAVGGLAYLESTNPANLRRYERIGFEARREVDLGAGLIATQMWREPAPG